MQNTQHPWGSWYIVLELSLWLFLATLECCWLGISFSLRKSESLLDTSFTHDHHTTNKAAEKWHTWQNPCHDFKWEKLTMAKMLTKEEYTLYQNRQLLLLILLLLVSLFPKFKVQQLLSTFYTNNENNRNTVITYWKSLWPRLMCNGTRDDLIHRPQLIMGKLSLGGGCWERKTRN